MRTISLQSGSNGNCIYVEADGVRLAAAVIRAAQMVTEVLE